MSKARLASGLTQPELAGILGVSKKAVDYYERRARKPNAEFVGKVAAALKVSPNYLFGFDLEDDSTPAPGPKPKMAELFDKLRLLPKSKQRIAIQLLEALLLAK